MKDASRYLERYTVIRFPETDVEDLIKLSSEFFHESGHYKNLTFDANLLRAQLEVRWREDPDFLTYVVLENVTGAYVGFAHFFREKVFSQEYIGETWQFYVKPEHRGTGASRLLAYVIDRQFEEWGCAISYAECGSALDNGRTNKLFFNLWSRFGYSFLGTSLFKQHRKDK